MGESQASGRVSLRTESERVRDGESLKTVSERQKGLQNEESERVSSQPRASERERERERERETQEREREREREGLKRERVSRESQERERERESLKRERERESESLNRAKPVSRSLPTNSEGNAKS